MGRYRYLVLQVFLASEQYVWSWHLRHTIYALALSHLIPALDLFNIKFAWFNEHAYNEFFPRKLLL